MAKSALEERFRLACHAVNLPRWEEEHRFHPTRKWRFDFAWPEVLVAVEIEGAVWARGRHTRGAGFIADCDKYNAAAAEGWAVIRFTSEHLKDSVGCAEFVAKLLEDHPR